MSHNHTVGRRVLELPGKGRIVQWSVVRQVRRYSLDLPGTSLAGPGSAPATLGVVVDVTMAPAGRRQVT